MQALPPLPDWCSLEHEVAKILTEQEDHGWYFDEIASRKLESDLRNELEEINRILRKRNPFVAGSEFTPKRDNKTSGYIKGATFTRLKEFNPSSRDHIAWILETKHSLKLTQRTTTGKPVIDEVILNEINTKFSKLSARYLELTKKLGMISEGVNSWNKLSTTSSRIHHHCSVAAATHRCCHRRPNLAQVPADEECRKLFTASPNHVLVGADLSGIELRMLAHYLARYDQGRYAEILLTGDIHQVNADKIGISRRAVKTVTYAFLYGAGDQKIGLSVDKQLSENEAKKKGKEVRKAYVDAIDGLSELLKAIKKAGERGFVRAIDGRKLLVDSPHKSLNFLLQGSAGVIAKRWLYIANQNLPKSAHQLAFIHDELQFECLPQDAKDLAFLLELSAKEAGEYYNLRIPIEAEAQQGLTWADVH
tara:strand:+ start:1839 stop:3101 length:1263 start_codon:yes stop_codon:yes gene_type:complete